MTRIKRAVTIITEGNNTINKNTDYYEVSNHEVENMLTKVAEGGNEAALREELIKNSEW